MGLVSCGEDFVFCSKCHGKPLRDHAIYISFTFFRDLSGFRKRFVGES